MKEKVLGFLATFFVLIGVWIGAFAAPGDAVLFPHTENGMSTVNVESLVAIDDTLYLLGANGLYSWKSGDAAPAIVSDKIVRYYSGNTWEELSVDEQNQYKDSVNLLLQRGDKLYGINSVKGSLLQFDITEAEVSLTEVVAFDWADMYIRESDYSYTKQIYGAVLAEKSLYLLVQQEGNAWNDYDLFSFDLLTGARTKLNAEHVNAIAAYEDGKLLCSIFDWDTMYGSDGKINYPALSIFDPISQSMTKIADFPESQVGGLAYDVESKMTYILGKGILYGLKPGGAFEAVAYMPVDYPGNHTPSALITGGLYAAIPNYGSVYVRNIDPTYMSEKVLRISGAYSDDTIRAFQAAYPDIPVVLADGELYNAETISQNMVSGSENIDLFVISLSYGGFESLRDKRYVGDLSQSAVLVSAADRMYPQFTQPLYKDGRLIALPYRFNSYGMGYSPAIMNELGIDQPPKTLVELMDLYVDWVETYSVEQTKYMLLEHVYDIRSELFSTILTSYMAYYSKTGEDLKFDTPLFRSLIAKLDEVTPILKELNPSQDEQQTMSFVYTDNTPTALLSSSFNIVPEKFYYDMGYKPLPLSLDDGLEPAIFSQIEVIILNPNSKNADLAMKYLEFYAENMPKNISIALNPDDNAPVERPEYTKQLEEAKKSLDEIRKQIETTEPENLKNLKEFEKSQEEYISYLEKNRYTIPAEAIQQYRSLVPYVCVDTENISFLTSSPEAYTLLNRYMQGEMDSLQFIKEFDRKLQMIRLENK